MYFKIFIFFVFYQPFVHSIYSELNIYPIQKFYDFCIFRSGGCILWPRSKNGYFLWLNDPFILFACILVIPCKVVGKFSIRLVPNMVPSKVDEFVQSYLQELWAQRGSPNKFKYSSSCYISFIINR